MNCEAGGLNYEIKAVALVACGTAVSAGTFFSESADAAALQILPVGFGAARDASWLAGAVAGYSWQRGAFVFGVEGDFSATGLKSEVMGSFANPLNNGFVYPSADLFARIDWYGTLRARAGWAVGSFLFDGTGGLADGQCQSDRQLRPRHQRSDLSIGPLNMQTSSVRFGWLAGAGAEYLINRNLSVNLEYQYVDLGFVSLAGVGAGAVRGRRHRRARPCMRSSRR